MSTEAGQGQFDGDGFISATAILPVRAGGTVTFQPSTGVDVLIQPVGYFDPATKSYTYAYTGDGLRRQKTAPDGTTTKFVWDRSAAVPELLAEVIDEPGTATDRTVRYLYGPAGTVTADVTTMTASGTETLRWFHHDQLGSTVAITSSTGGLLSTFSYTPVGAVASATGSATTPMGWTGEYRDTETGFTYLRARYYDPATAQLLTRDPLEALSRSAYGYAGNNPLNFTDPTGLWPGEGLVKSIGDFFTGGDCGDGILGGLKDAVTDIGDFVWKYRDEIVFGLAVVGSFTCAVCTAAFYASMGLSTVSTINSCASGDGGGCPLGITSLALAGGGRLLSNGAAPALSSAGQARTGAGAWHPIQRLVTGPLLEGTAGAVESAGKGLGLGSDTLSGIDVVNG